MTAPNPDPAATAARDEEPSASSSETGAIADGESIDDPAGDPSRSILRVAFRSIRERPLLLVPFFFAGILGATSTLAKIESPYSVGFSSFPQDGIVSISVPLVPAVEPTIEFGPATLRGLKLEYLVLLVGWQAAVAFATASAFAVVVWSVSRETSGFVPPLTRIRRLFGYVLAVQGSMYGLLYAITAISLNDFAMLLILPGFLLVAVALFLAPAYIVLGGARPIAAVSESIAHRRPITVTVWLLGLGYLGYALTGVGHAVPWSTLGIALGTVVSVAVTGTVHAVIVAAAYRRWTDEGVETAEHTERGSH